MELRVFLGQQLSKGFIYTAIRATAYVWKPKSTSKLYLHLCEDIIISLVAVCCLHLGRTPFLLLKDVTCANEFQSFEFFFSFSSPESKVHRPSMSCFDQLLFIVCHLAQSIVDWRLSSGQGRVCLIYIGLLLLTS